MVAERQIVLGIIAVDQRQGLCQLQTTKAMGNVLIRRCKMTKQIDNKAVEEMGELLKVIEKDVIRSCTGFCRGCDSKYKEYDNLTCYFMNIAERLYNVGYKQEKETAKEILQYLWNFDPNNLIEEIAEEYGVEVE